MLKLLKIVFLMLLTGLVVYVLPMSPEFPPMPPESLQSTEPGDKEDPFRRAYFTNLNREEVVEHYRSNFPGLVTIRLNHPPEEAGAKIRNLTRSTYLEELVHPLRESVYINGFEPKVEKDAINIEGVVWEQKITVKYVPSGVVPRVAVYSLASLAFYLLIKEILS